MSMSLEYKTPPSPRPWRIEHVTRQREALVKGADNSIVAVMDADNAILMVRAVNAYGKEQDKPKE